MWPQSATWRQQAACADDGPDGFFESGGDVQVCAGCVVKDDCLEFGMREEYGVWGGLDPRQRRALRHQRRMQDPNYGVTRQTLVTLLREAGYTGSLSRTRWQLVEIYEEMLAAS